MLNKYWYHQTSEVQRANLGYYQNPHFPLSLIIQHQSLRIGVVHGQQVVPAGDPDMLAALARQMDVDVLISGGTHR